MGLPKIISSGSSGDSSILSDIYLEEANNLSDLTNAATARTNLGIVAGGAGDIWVEKAGDTMTGTLEIDVATATDEALILKTTDDSTTNPLVVFADSAANIAEVTVSSDDLTIETLVQDKDVIFYQNSSRAGFGASSEIMRLDASRPSVRIAGAPDTGGNLAVGGVGRIALGEAPDGGNIVGSISVVKFSSGSWAAFNAVSTSANHQVYYGGGFGGLGAATQLRFYTTASVSDTVGTQRLFVNGTGNFLFQGFTSSTVGISIQGAASQTADLTQWLNSASNVLAYVDANGGAVFNENGNDADFRVEGDTVTSLLHVDASTDRVGIATATPSVTLDVNGIFHSRQGAVINEDANDSDTRIEGQTLDNLLYIDAGQDFIGSGTSSPGAEFHIVRSLTPRIWVQGSTDDTDIAIVLMESAETVPTYGFEVMYDGSPNQFQINAYDASTTAQTRLIIERSSGNVGIGNGISSTSAKLHVDGTADIIQLLVQAHSTQNANIAEFQNSGGTALAYIDGTGGGVFTIALEVPNGAGGTTVDATGEVTVDSTSGSFNFYDGSSEKVLHPERSKSITIENPGSSEDISIFFTNRAITVTEMRAVLVGSSTPSVTWTIRHHATDRSNAGNEVVTSGTTTTSTTSGSDVTSFNDATIPADSFVWLETTAQSGTVTELHVTIFYTIDA